MSEFLSNLAREQGFSVPVFLQKRAVKRSGFVGPPRFPSILRPLETPGIPSILAKWIKSGSKKQEPGAPPWFRFVADIDWLLNSCDYLKLTAPLAAIREQVVTTRRVTAGQQHAVERIRERVSEGV